jgi:hypothetical protein
MLVDDGLNSVEEGRDALYFVDQHRSDRGGGAQELTLQALRVGHELPERGEAREIDDQVWLKRREQGGLAHLARTEQEHVAAMGR